MTDPDVTSLRDELAGLCLPFILWGNGTTPTDKGACAREAAAGLADTLLAAGWRKP